MVLQVSNSTERLELLLFINSKIFLKLNTPNAFTFIHILMYRLQLLQYLQNYCAACLIQLSRNCISSSV